MSKIDPYHDSDKLGWKQITFDQPDMSYEFNTLCFWRTDKGLVFTAQDSGCSCPSPFEDYNGDTAVEIEQKLERVGSFEQAQRTIDAWNKDYNNKPYLNSAEIRSELEQLESWFNDPHLTQQEEDEVKSLACREDKHEDCIWSGQMCGCACHK